jgi:hypothetical protein
MGLWGSELTVWLGLVAMLVLTILLVHDVVSLWHRCSTYTLSLV